MSAGRDFASIRSLGRRGCLCGPTAAFQSDSDE
jgi:hypothetical protein